MKGRVLVESVGSVVLKGNPLGDPRLREVPVYLPPSYAVETAKRYPVVFYLTGFSGTGRMLLNAQPWKENFFERLDRLVAGGRVPECLVVAPDCFTRYGGSQYMNSPATGRYEDHVVDELAPYVDGKFRTVARAEGRAVMGKSSGGFGALRLAMRHPEVFGHAACHSGDMGFDLSYYLDIPKCVDRLARYGGSFAGFLKAFNAARPGERGEFPHELVNMAGMASCYSPAAGSPLGFALPFDERTGELKPAVWRRWLAHDPALLVGRHAAALKRLKTIFLDCGTKDEFYLHLGARRFARELKARGIRHVYEEHDRGHFDTAGRYEVSLKLLGKRLAKA